MFVVDASYFSIAHLQTMSNQANGETRHDNLRRLQDQKRTVEMQLSQKAQELLQLRLVGLEAETKWLPFLQMTLSNAFSWMKILQFPLKFH